MLNKKRLDFDLYRIVGMLLGAFVFVPYKLKPYLVVIFVVMVLFWVLLLRRPLIKRFEYLDHQHWSFEFVDTSIAIQGRTITKIIDHQAYITIYFSDTQYQPLTIWWDQLSISQWKNLKLLIKML